ncbi:hypothetical protein EV142_101659 [Flavobacterium circumlabens]|uniref:Uncharacterized protein n=1 Tax=Flavobacterium circumlabens TaxID=2133765 RepID=A0ABY2B5G0_9FLAO|nr:hypothetical protein EV142_101402 [Flavobacterium circumlabens]TCN61072.1 hypothetical protein EV142_101659 [Flavobacterium circumlabens]
MLRLKKILLISYFIVIIAHIIGYVFYNESLFSLVLGLLSMGAMILVVILYKEEKK